MKNYDSEFPKRFDRGRAKGLHFETAREYFAWIKEHPAPKKATALAGDRVNIEVRNVIRVYEKLREGGIGAAAAEELVALSATGTLAKFTGVAGYQGKVN